MRIGVLVSIGRTIDAFFPEIMSEWRDRGHEVYPAAGEAGRVNLDLIPGLTRNPRLHNILAVRALRQWVQNRELDVVVTNTATASALARISRLSCPVIYFCHGLHWSAKSPATRDIAWRTVERILLPRTDAIISLNSEDTEWFERRIRYPQFVHRLQYGVGLDTQRFLRSARREVETKRLIWAGEFTPRKRPEDAVAVMRSLRGRGCLDVELVMAGTGPLLAQTQRLVADWGLDAHVQCVGHVDVADLLSSGSALLHTAAWEGLPRVALEALSVGRPVFGYDVKGIQDLSPAATAPFPDVHALATIIEEYDWTSGGEEYPAESDLSYGAAAEQILRVIRRALDGRAKSG